MNDIQDQINDMLKDSPEQDAEEYAIHDYEGFGGYGLGEYEGIESVHEIACFLEEHSEIGGELLSHFGGSLDDATKAAEESYTGSYTSLADYAQELTEQTSEVPKHLEFYIDYEKIGREHWEETGEWLVTDKKGADGKGYVLEHGTYAGEMTVSALQLSLARGQRGLSGGSSVAKLNKELKSKIKNSTLVAINIDEEDVDSHPSP